MRRPYRCAQYRSCTKDKRTLAGVRYSMPYKMYGNRIFQNANFDLYGRRRDPGPDFQPTQIGTYRGGTHIHSQTDFRGFIATAWPADRPPLPVTMLEIWIFILKYNKNPYAEYILK